MDKAKIMVMSFIVILVFGLIIYQTKFLSRCNKISCLEFSKKSTYRPQETYENTSQVYRAFYSRTSQADLLRVEQRSNISQTDAKKYAFINLARIKGLYEKAKSPYPGDISDTIECEEQYKLSFHSLKKNNVEFDYYVTYLNNQLQYGACTKEQVFHKVYLITHYCAKQKNWYQLEFITKPKDDEVSEKKYEEILQSIRCTDNY